MSWPVRGEIYWVALDPTVGGEIAKTRPALIISNNIGNQYSDRVIVAPITSGNTHRVFPFEVFVSAGESGLKSDSKVLLDQIRAVAKRRLGARIGALDEKRLIEVGQAIRLSLAV